MSGKSTRPYHELCQDIYRLQQQIGRDRGLCDAYYPTRETSALDLQDDEDVDRGTRVDDLPEAGDDLGHRTVVGDNSEAGRNADHWVVVDDNLEAGDDLDYETAVGGSLEADQNVGHGTVAGGAIKHQPNVQCTAESSSFDIFLPPMPSTATHRLPNNARSNHRPRGADEEGEGRAGADGANAQASVEVAIDQSVGGTSLLQPHLRHIATVRDSASVSKRDRVFCADLSRWRSSLRGLQGRGDDAVDVEAATTHRASGVSWSNCHLSNATTTGHYAFARDPTRKRSPTRHSPPRTTGNGDDNHGHEVDDETATTQGASGASLSKHPRNAATLSNFTSVQYRPREHSPPGRLNRGDDGDEDNNEAPKHPRASGESLTKPHSHSTGASWKSASIRDHPYKHSLPRRFSSDGDVDGAFKSQSTNGILLSSSCSHIPAASGTLVSVQDQPREHSPPQRTRDDDYDGDDDDAGLPSVSSTGGVEISFLRPALKSPQRPHQQPEHRDQPGTPSRLPSKKVSFSTNFEPQQRLRHHEEAQSRLYQQKEVPQAPEMPLESPPKTTPTPTTSEFQHHSQRYIKARSRLDEQKDVPNAADAPLRPPSKAASCLTATDPQRRLEQQDEAQQRFHQQTEALLLPEMLLRHPPKTTPFPIASEFQRHSQPHEEDHQNAQLSYAAESRASQLLRTHSLRPSPATGINPPVPSAGTLTSSAPQSQLLSAISTPSSSLRKSSGLRNPSALMKPSTRLSTVTPTRLTGEADHHSRSNAAHQTSPAVPTQSSPFRTQTDSLDAPSSTAGDLKDATGLTERGTYHIPPPHAHSLPPATPLQQPSPSPLMTTPRDSALLTADFSYPTLPTSSPAAVTPSLYSIASSTPASISPPQVTPGRVRQLTSSWAKKISKMSLIPSVDLPKLPRRTGIGGSNSGRGTLATIQEMPSPRVRK